MSEATEVRIFSNPKKTVKAMAKEIFRLTKSSVQESIHILLSGGKTPALLFQKLSSKYAAEIEWDRIHFWWGDERCVSPDDDQSNFKSANDLLLSQISIPKQNIHRIKGENNPEEEALRYAKEIKLNLNFRGDSPVFDLVILGLGDDGHTASIFPDELELFEDERICAVTRHPLSGQLRITITGKVLNNANRVFFLVTGESKAQRIAEIMNDDEAAKLLPAYYISPKNGELIWFIDEAAAAKIL
ncbi:MAG TPA: 6-phosphogluconolactonase [Prolixibacteraceae bacterium]|nr:6-phosphogluconolactonase [Prolixibacteraceae bacterium]